jgi:hypothetical protein
VTSTATKELRYHGATDADRDALLTAVSAYSLRVARDRSHFSRRPVYLDAGRFDELPGYRYWAPSWAKWAPVITVDSDNEYDHDLVNNLPVTPNWIGINSSSGHSQYVFYLDDPVYGQGLTRSYYNHVAKRLTRSLNGDPHFSRGLARNPLDESGEYEWHAQHRDGFTLYEIDGVIEVLEEDFADTGAGAPRSGRIDLAYQLDEHGPIHRKLHLFDVARSHGYSARGRGEFVQVLDIVSLLRSESEALSSVDPRLANPDAVILSIARSVARFCNTRMAAGVRGRGGSPLYTREQQVAGGRTQGRRNVESGHMGQVKAIGDLARSLNATEGYEAIRQAYIDGQRNISQLAREFGVSRPTIYKALRPTKV